MQLNIPRSSSASRVIVTLPTGGVLKFDSVGPHDPNAIVLPEGVCEDDVEVAFCTIGNNGQPSSEPVILKTRVEAPAADPLDVPFISPNPWSKHASETRLPETEDDGSDDGSLEDDGLEDDEPETA